MMEESLVFELDCVLRGGRHNFVLLWYGFVSRDVLLFWCHAIHTYDRPGRSCCSLQERNLTGVQAPIICIPYVRDSRRWFVPVRSSLLVLTSSFLLVSLSGRIGDEWHWWCV